MDELLLGAVAFLDPDLEARDCFSVRCSGIGDDGAGQQGGADLRPVGGRAVLLLMVERLDGRLCGFKVERHRDYSVIL